ncbi:hypothetical protein [Hydrogenophaga sp. RWCD_12]|uniref:hypothetical protein n=1 Tax=Hydrogenophaga sp. RWCD_12 TaxID=3391190 RepID=UPI003984B6C7
MLLSLKELLSNPAATDWVEDRIAQPKQMAETDAASPGVVVVRVPVKVSSNVDQNPHYGKQHQSMP